MHKNYKSFVFALLGAGLMSQFATADPIRFSIIGTAGSTDMGYTLGDSYTFYWVINDGYAGGDYDSFSSSYNRWGTQETNSPALWESVYGSGLTGSYSRPSGELYAPNDSIYNDDQVSDYFSLYAGNDSPLATSLGLMVDGVQLRKVEAAQIVIGEDFAFSGGFNNPATYWENYTGSYSATGGISLLDEDSNTIDFVVSGVTIEAIPEPVSLALIGLFGGGLIAVRRFF